MIWLRWLPILTIGVLISNVVLAQPAPLSALDGDWDGALAVPGGIKLRLFFHFETVANATTATMTSIDQGGTGMPVTTINRDGNTVTLTIPKIMVEYKGVLSADGKAMTGEWTQGGHSMPLALALRPPGQSGPVVKRPQNPVRPYPYRDEDVTYDGPSGERLAATLTMPNGAGPFPAAILIVGSGPHDRDEAIMGHKPFLVLADYLTRHGIAVLRFDKRGIGKSTGDYKNATSADFAADTEAGIAFLKTRTEINPKKIGLIGHSEGGIIAPMVAAKDHSVAFIALMAGTGIKGSDLLPMQGRLVAMAMGQPAAEAEKSETINRGLYQAIASGRDREDATAKAEAYMASLMPKTDPRYLAVEQSLPNLASPWFRFFLSYDPAPAFKQVKCPVLALNGAKDLQVPPKEDLAAIKAALAGNPDVTIIELPGLNHLFQTADTGAPSEYANIEETIAPSVLETISDWIIKHAH